MEINNRFSTAPYQISGRDSRRRTWFDFDAVNWWRSWFLGWKLSDFRKPDSARLMLEVQLSGAKIKA